MRALRETKSPRGITPPTLSCPSTGRPRPWAPAGPASHPALPTSVMKGLADSEGDSSLGGRIPGLPAWLSPFMKPCTGTAGCWRVGGGWGTLSGGLCTLGHQHELLPLRRQPCARTRPHFPLSSKQPRGSCCLHKKRAGRGVTGQGVGQMTGPRSHSCSLTPSSHSKRTLPPPPQLWY